MVILHLDAVKKLINNNTKIIALPHITNSLGSLLPIKEICYEAKKHNIITVIDGCQAAPHIPIDLQDLNCDFYVFSGHKVYGPSGNWCSVWQKKYFRRLRSLSDRRRNDRFCFYRKIYLCPTS